MVSAVILESRSEERCMLFAQGCFSLLFKTRLKMIQLFVETRGRFSVQFMHPKPEISLLSSWPVRWNKSWTFCRGIIPSRTDLVQITSSSCSFKASLDLLHEHTALVGKLSHTPPSPCHGKELGMMQQKG